MSWCLKREKPGVKYPEENHPLALTQKVDIGAADGNDVRVKCINNHVGKYHAVIFFKDNCPYVKDLGSLYGTFVNGVKLKDKTFKLGSGDIIRFGCGKMCLHNKGCFRFEIKKDESYHVNVSKEIVQVQKCFELKQKFLKVNEDTRAKERCKYNVDVTKEIAQLMRQNVCEKQKGLKENEDASDHERSQYHLGKQTAQVPHSAQKQKRLEKNEDTRANKGGQYDVVIKERAQVGDLRHGFVEQLKSLKVSEDTRAGHKEQYRIGKETVQVHHNVEKQNRVENNKDKPANRRGPCHIGVTKKTALVRDHRHDLAEKPKRPKGRENENGDERGQYHIGKKTERVRLEKEKQKHPEENEDSRDIEGGQYYIDVTREIAQTRRNLENIQKRAEENEDLRKKQMEDTLASEKLQQEIMAKIMPQETIPGEPPGREFIKGGLSFCDFNADSLEKPSTIEDANTNDFLPFCQYLRKSLQDMSPDNFSNEHDFDTVEKENADSIEVLEYILLLTSVHQDELIVVCSTDLLLEFNSQWVITQRTIRKILLNWGADVDQIMPSLRRPPRTLKNNLETVSEENVIAVLRVLSAQVKVRKVCETSFSEKWDEYLFGMLVLLSLDNKFTGCYPEVLNCLCALLENIDEKGGPNWAYEYSKKLLQLESDHYNLTSIVCNLLNGSIAAERLRVNASFAAIQRIIGVPMDKINFQFDWRNRELNRCVKSTTLLAALKPLDIYCLLIFIDIILRHPRMSDKTKRRFNKWLEKLDQKIGINPHLNALISNYRVLWDVEIQGN